MAEFAINLIRDRVMPRGKRRVAFWSALLYLLACGVAIVVTAHTRAKLIATTLAKRDEIAALDSRFRAEHPGSKGPIAFKQQLHGKLLASAAAVESVDRVVSGRTSVGAILVWLMQPVPSAIHLTDFAFDSKLNTVEFSLAVPLNSSMKSFQSDELIAKWKSNHDLTARLADIKLVVSERQEVEREPFYIWKFAGRVVSPST